MLRSSFPAGRLFGVELRVHISFPLLLLVAVGFSVAATGSAVRGLGLWLSLVLAVAVRETARALAGAYARLRLRALFLLPVGGVMAFAPGRGGVQAANANTRLISWAAPVANVLVGLLMLGMCYGFQPGLHLFEQPWIGVHHILRSFIWMQFIMAAVGLLPSTLPSRAAAAAEAKAKADNKPSILRAFNFGSAVAISVVLAGMVATNMWLVMLGAFMLLFAQLTAAQQPLAAPEAESIRVRDVMLTEYTLLSTSDTLTGALERTVHSLQDVFPVVRGDRLVGSVARGTLVDALQMQGEGYLQGVMTRGVQTAAPDENLVDALRRSAALGASEFIPVVEDGMMLGILTPQSLSRAVSIVKTPRPVRGEE